MGIGNRVKEARLRLGLTQAQLAALIGTTKGAIGNYESGTSHPKEPILLKLIEVLKVDANYLFQDLVQLPRLDSSAQALDLLGSFNKLNDLGKKEATKRVEELTYIPKYASQDETSATSEDTFIVKENEETYFLSKYKNLARELPLFEYPASAGTGIYAGENQFENVPVSDEILINAHFGIKISGNSMFPRIPNGSIAWVRQQSDVNLGEICIVVINGEGYCKIKGVNGFESINPDYPTIKISESDTYKITGKVVYVQNGQ